MNSDCAEKACGPKGSDDAVAKRLWEESARLVGLDQDEKEEQQTQTAIVTDTDSKQQTES